MTFSVACSAPHQVARVFLAALLLVLGWLVPPLALAQRVLWADAPLRAAARHPVAKGLGRYRVVEFQLATLQQALQPALAAGQAQARGAAEVVISLPLPDGTSGRFRLAAVPVLPAALAAHYPQIATYMGQGLDDVTATARLDLTPAGFHAQILSTTGTTYIDPAAPGSATHLVFDRTAIVALPAPCYTAAPARLAAGKRGQTKRLTSGEQLRTYQIAVACTGEYTQAKGGTRAGALAAIVTSINRVSGIYERELAIRLTLVPKEDSIIYLNPATDPYTNQTDDNSLNTNQRTIDKRIGEANYDVGHLFTTDGGGLALLGVVCLNGEKAKGITGLSNPTGDAFDVDFVAHEIGHQFGANHTFNGNTGNCSGANREAQTAYEPGSGSTIMAYAGICAPQNLQPNSDPYFHTISLEEIIAYTTQGTGNSCAAVTSTGNHAPTANAGARYLIPVNTPFTLTGAGTDADGDALTYSWEQFNLGPDGFPDLPSDDAPIFRSFLPASSPTRTFPRLPDILANQHTIGELLPSYERQLLFRLTVRDNRAGGGGIATDTVSIPVIGTAGPFKITEPSGAQTWLAGSPQLIRWDVANTDQTPINTAAVSIRLSTDGGLTFPVTLAANTPNDGHETIILPAATKATTNARIKVEAVGNVYFDISDESLSIQVPSGPAFSLSQTENAPTELNLCPGTTGQASLTVSPLNGFSGTVNLAATQLPAGVTVSFSPAQLTATGTTVVTLNIPLTLALGNYSVTIEGTSGSQKRGYVLRFSVRRAVTAVPTLRTPRTSPQGTLPLFAWSQVALAQSYELQVANNPEFTNPELSTSLSDTAYVPQNPLSEQTTYYWRVRGVGSECGPGPYSAVASFKTGAMACARYASLDVPKPMPAAGTVSITSVIRVSTDELIADVNVRDLRISYPNLGDLTVELTAPSGRKVLLTEAPCPGSANLHASFDDQATSAINCPLNTGQTALPQTLLARLQGQPANGNWTLTIQAPQAQEGNALLGWTLELCTVQGSGTISLSTTDPLAGASIFPNPAPGNIYLQLENARAGTLQVRVLDALGRQVHDTSFNKAANPSIFPLHLSRLAAGLYFVQVQAPDGKIITLRLLKL
ncbi:reprolysin-like metallopeptidase [Hymenobacter sp. DG25B]|uniref:reprolysin-like metallopeptidase n=1 Tax=Hymenobacter sp. DG25B TaxID=1385664 RepID=UPI000662760B|nr:zinc-dependent metalloprotease family protein [Hymenobacter sp. DG25B]